MTCTELKSIPLISIVHYLDLPVSKVNHREAWLKNPFNGGLENTASTKIDLRRNVWYSHSEGFGGNNIDFLSKLLGTNDIFQILKWADERKNNFSFQQRSTLGNTTAREIKKETSYFIQHVGQLRSGSLFEYLMKRKIDLTIANEHCQEIRYTASNGKSYYAICFANDSNGYELRNPYDKRSLLIKDITTVSHDQKEAFLFEGFMDLLSWLTIRKQAGMPFQKVDYCVLNTTANLTRSFPFLERYKKITSFLDADPTGRLCFLQLQQVLDQGELINGTSDFKMINPNIKDVNDYLIYLSTGISVPLDPVLTTDQLGQRLSR
ncbi:toprim domain-containing protein [Albibacterium sp.]|uniref:toprim domain-containing protein n=1 Tax=Albibacterium sp. TaxID=2952885 RepID=UPI002C6159B5|nr:toprim domain-containing protein [Albibacterium sp.]HUH18560.1 toprim domain-containing protein [Albibacterium sp.]